MRKKLDNIMDGSMTVVEETSVKHASHKVTLNWFINFVLNRKEINN
jgi:hypothetical protein